MNALLRKEIRLIAPACVAAVALSIAPIWFISRENLSTFLDARDRGTSTFFSFWLFLGLIFPALSSFGQEFSLGTFSNLLAQPIARARVWRLKLTLVFAASALVILALLASMLLRFGWLPILGPITLGSFLFAAVAVSGGLWTTLLFRQVAAAFWFALLIPFVLFLLSLAALSWTGRSELVSIGFPVLLLAYAVFGLIAARHLFFNAEDAAWLGHIISPWQFTSRAAVAQSLSRRQHRPLWMTLRKEFQLQQVTFILAAAMAALHLFDLAVRRFCLSYLSANPSIRNIIEVAPLLWLLAPILAGAASVAEERKLATLESNLCAPLSRRLQFAVKLTIALALGFLFGGVAPLFLEQLGQVAGVKGGIDSLQVQHHLVSTNLILLFSSLIISLLSFYASTLTRNTLQALGVAVAAIIIFDFIANFATDPLRFEDRPLWGIPLANAIGIPLSILALAFLAWRNYGHLHFGARVWRRNVSLLLGVWLFTIAADVCIFNRVWESWLPLEPSHPWSAFIPRPAADQVEIAFNNDVTAVIAKDGRLWFDNNNKPPHFLPGSDWKIAAVSTPASYAIKNDGSLWDITVDPKRFLANTAWRDIVSKNLEFVALNADGTIWTWGNRHTRQTNLQNFPPRQVSPDTDWKLICASHWAAMAEKNDGSIWAWGSLPTPTRNTNVFIPQPKLRVSPSGKEITAMAAAYDVVYALASDHTLWSAEASAADEPSQLAPLGTEAIWSDIKVADLDLILGLQTNGTIWMLSRGSAQSLSEEIPLSGYACWAGLSHGGVIGSDGYGYRTALAVSTDGALIRFRYDIPYWPQPEWVRPESWMAPSRLKGTRIADLTKPSN